MKEITSVAVLLIGSVFAVAGAAKLRHWGTFIHELMRHELLPRMLVRPVALAVCAGELAGAIMVVLPGTRQSGAVILLVLLVIFTAVITRSLSRGKRELPCACFGNAYQRVSWGIPFRNAVMAAVLGLVLASSVDAGTTLAGWAGALVGTVLVWVVSEALRFTETGRAKT